MKLSGEWEYTKKKNFKSPRLLVVIPVLVPRGLHYLLDLTTSSPIWPRPYWKREDPGSQHLVHSESETWCASRATRERKGLSWAQLSPYTCTLCTWTRIWSWLRRRCFQTSHKFIENSTDFRLRAVSPLAVYSDLAVAFEAVREILLFSRRINNRRKNKVIIEKKANLSKKQK